MRYTRENKTELTLPTPPGPGQVLDIHGEGKMRVVSVDYGNRTIILAPAVGFIPDRR